MIYPTLAHFRHFRHFRHLRNFSSLFTNLRSTPVENVRQITPFYAKQSQSQVGQNQPKLLYDKYICNLGHLVIQTNKANSNPTCSELVEPIDERPKMMQSVHIQRITKKMAAMGPKKQIQNKSNFIFLLSQNRPNVHYIARTRILNNFLRCCYV